jgi:hypothetical protein
MEHALSTSKEHYYGFCVMKIELLKNSFRGVIRQEEATLGALAIVPRKRRELPVAGRYFDSVNEPKLAARSALLSLAAATFDPLRLSRAAAESLIEFLQDGELLSSDDANFLMMLLRFGTEKHAVLNLYSYIQMNLPAISAKDRGLSLLDDIIGLRYRAAS